MCSAPSGRDAASRAGLALETVVDGRACRTRAEFDAIGLTSRYHSCLVFGFDWQVDGRPTTDAVRETYEEIGLRGAEVLGALPPVHTTQKSV